MCQHGDEHSSHRISCTQHNPKVKKQASHFHFADDEAEIEEMTDAQVFHAPGSRAPITLRYHLNPVF